MGGLGLERLGTGLRIFGFIGLRVQGLRFKGLRVWGLEL